MSCSTLGSRVEKILALLREDAGWWTAPEITEHFARKGIDVRGEGKAGVSVALHSLEHGEKVEREVMENGPGMGRCAYRWRAISVRGGWEAPDPEDGAHDGRRFCPHCGGAL